MEEMEKFFGFMEKNLDEVTERNLFFELASNDELRSEFRCFTAVAESARANVNYFEPTQAQKASLFAKAGITMYPAAETGIATSSASVFNTAINSKGFLSVITMTAMLVIMSLFYKPQSDEISNYRKENIQKTTEPVPTVSSYEHPESKAAGKEQKTIIYRNIYHTIKTVEAGSENAVEIADDERNSALTLSNISEFKRTNEFEDIQRENYSKIDNLNNLTNIFDNLHQRENGLSIEFKNATSWNLPKETINPAEFSKLNNLAFDLYYKLSDKIKIGAGVKQETFYAEYYGQESDGFFYLYKQHPNLTSISAGVRYYPYDLGSLRTFAQLNVGGNQAGWIARPLLGFEFFPARNFSLIFGFEYSYFSFKHQNARFSSSKAGLSYGLSYNF